MSPSLTLILSVLTKLVFALLVGLSCWSLALILGRKRVFRSFDDREAFPLLLQGLRDPSRGSTEIAPESAGIRAQALGELRRGPGNSSAKEHLYRAKLLERKSELEANLSILASLGSNAPFIGLFGTVLGIIQAFGTLSNGASAMNAVMFAIAEALVATAVGLFVAIPAVLAFNNYNRRIRALVQDCETLKECYLGLQT